MCPKSITKNGAGAMATVKNTVFIGLKNTVFIGGGGGEGVEGIKIW